MGRKHEPERGKKPHEPGRRDEEQKLYPGEGIEFFGEEGTPMVGEPRPRHPDDVDADRADEEEEK